MFLDRKREVEKQIADLQNVLEVINFKCLYYETAIAAGTEKIHTQNQPFPDDLCLDKWHKNEKRLVKWRPLSSLYATTTFGFIPKVADVVRCWFSGS